jgi:hypothetical protein
MMAAASTSETSANFHQTTQHNIPEDSHIHSRRRENLKSHPQGVIFSHLVVSGEDPFFVTWFLESLVVSSSCLYL